MKLHVHSKQDYIRLEFNGGDPWNSSNFFHQLDSMYHQLKDAYTQAPRPIVFDFTETAHVDSSVITLVVQALRLADEKQRISIVAPSEETMGLFHLMGFGKLTDLYFSMEEYEQEHFE